MKKLTLLLAFGASIAGMQAQTEVWDGVTIVEHMYTQKISDNGVWAVGFSPDGGTITYNIVTGLAAYYPNGDYGRGHVVSNNGWVVGCEMIEDQASRAVVMSDGKMWYPSVFPKGASSNLHSITPDGSRVCGVVGGTSRQYDNLPIYCDIDADGNFGEIKYLPFPDTTFLGNRPQYCSATWISSDGKTIAGQVIDGRGFIVYPVLYKQAADGSWSWSTPSEKLFNPKNLPIPEPIGEMEDVFPDVPYPEIQDFMTAAEYAKFLLADEPYDRLDEFMDVERMYEYYMAVDAYIEAQDKYMQMFDEYDRQYWEIFDSSVFFYRNAMTLSSDGKWLASSAEVDDMSDPMNPVQHYIPYLCNLETGEWVKFGDGKHNYHTNQVLPGGVAVVNSVAGTLPASTYLYFASTGNFVSLYEFINENESEYGAWYKKYMTGDIIVGEGNNGYVYAEDVTITGQAAISQDFSVIAGGSDGYVLDKDMYFTYIFNGLEGGVESIESEMPVDGVYRVFNLQGVNVLNTKDASEVNTLPAGIYIVNGKKVYLR